MQFNNKTTRNVADAVSKILSGQTVSEELKGNQHKIDKNKNGKIDAHDFKLLRGEKKVNEESCEDEAKEEVKKHEKKHHGKDGEVSKHEKEMHKEDVDLDEAVLDATGKPVDHAKVFKSETDTMHPGTKKYVGRAGGKEVHAKKDVSGNVKFYHRDGIKGPLRSVTKEEVEQLDEYNAKDGRYVHKGSYGTAKGAEYGETDYDKENKMEKELNKKKPARKGYGARQNFVRSYAKEDVMTFSGLVESYKKDGLKAIAKMKKEEVEDLDEAEKMKGEDPCWDNYEMVGHKMKGGKKVPNCVPKNEEVDSETYKKEMQDQKDKFDGKKKGADIAKPSVQAVSIEEDVVAEGSGAQAYDEFRKTMIKQKGTPKSPDSKQKTDGEKAYDEFRKDMLKKGGVRRTGMKEDVEMSIDDINGVKMSTIEERTLTEPEAKKKEEYVKGMKKNLAGFKERYGKDAKSVMYATATKNAKED
jgi:hypothetical protein